MKNRTLMLITLFIMFATLNANASINLSAYRVYMDDKQPRTEMMIINNESVPQECTTSIRHHKYTEGGSFEVLPDGVVPDWSALNLMRYSPKNFTIAPKTMQVIKFVKRRRLNSSDGEFLAILSLVCSGRQNTSNLANSNQPVSIAPRLRHNLPIVIRNGELSAEITFRNVLVEEEVVTFELARDGERSVYGVINLVDVEKNELIDSVKNVSIYPGSSFKSFKLLHKNVSKLQLQFVENPEFGGQLTITENVNN